MHVLVSVHTIIMITAFCLQLSTIKFEAYVIALIIYCILSYDVASGSEITPCNKICKPLVVYRFMGKVMTSITTLRHIDKIITFLRQK